MNLFDIDFDKLYYVVVYDCKYKIWKIVYKKIIRVSDINMKCPFCYYDNGITTLDFIFDNKKESISKKNIMNAINKKNKKYIFYKGKIVYIKNHDKNIKSIITDIDFGKTNPDVTIRPMPYTDFAKDNKDFCIVCKITDINDKFLMFDN